jgi:hypothetical protein
MKNTPIHIILPAHMLEFMEFENQLLIRMSSLDHITKSETKFNVDAIT